MEKKENLKTVIEAVMKRRKIKTQKALMENMGYKTPGHLSNLLSGRTEITAPFLRRMEKTYNINPEYVETGKGPIFKRRKASDNMVDASAEIENAANEASGESTLAEDYALISEMVADVMRSQADVEFGATPDDDCDEECLCMDGGECTCDDDCCCDDDCDCKCGCNCSCGYSGTDFTAVLEDMVCERSENREFMLQAMTSVMKLRHVVDKAVYSNKDAKFAATLEEIQQAFEHAIEEIFG